jgi:hypothetical protein
VNELTVGVALVVTAGIGLRWYLTARTAERARLEAIEERDLARSLLERAVANEVAPREIALRDLAEKAGFASYEFLVCGHPMVVLLPNRSVSNEEAERVFYGCIRVLHDLADSCERAIPRVSVNAAGGKA